MTDGGPLLDVRIANLAETVLDETMVERDEPWIYDLGEVDGHHLVIAVNTDETNLIEPERCMTYEAEPLRMLLWDNGWLAYIGPGNSMHMGPPAAEDRWIDALEAEVERHGGDLTPEAES